eukprot:TRINITY_DN10450_c0_g1_i1.p1 TRINITY_DN10450_c0_g1~~TRINITY_DN10450_c0_g1_i1.p1  ORF type:complete len:156 (-),score=50.45 TRINITY_DN10450_c0_g1_i1:32-499(-)
MQRGLVGSEMCIRDRSTQSTWVQKERKKLDPDENIKKKICERLSIPLQWLEENDPKIRFRQNMIKNINRDEKQSQRSLKILCDYLGKKRNTIQLRGKDTEQIAITKQLQNEFSVKFGGLYLYPVSYTHLTLPTILLVQISVVAVSLKKKKKTRML